MTGVGPSPALALIDPPLRQGRGRWFGSSFFFQCSITFPGKQSFGICSLLARCENENHFNATIKGKKGGHGKQNKDFFPYPDLIEVVKRWTGLELFLHLAKV